MDHILNQDDKEQVLGPYLLGSRFACKNGFANPWIQEVLITKKQALSTVSGHF